MSAPAPSSDAQADDADALACPLCGYDLRGLPAHRCPECGHAFDPDALRAARDERRDWFFEAAPPRARIRGFARTAAASARPFAFWWRVSPAWPIAWPRLVAWAAAWAGLIGALAAGLLVTATVDAWDRAHTPVGPMLSGRFGGPPPPANTPSYQAWGMARFTWLDAIAMAWHGGSAGPAAARLAFVLLAWPVAAWLAMRCFAVTLGRAGVRAGHPWRCVAYAWPSAIVPAAIAGAVAHFGFAYGRPPSLIGDLPRYWLWQAGLDADTAEYALLAAIVGSGVHLVAAHVRYLRLPHAVAQALLVQLVAWLAIGAVAVGATQWLR